MCSKRLLALGTVTGGLLLGGCTPVDAGLGEAVKYDQLAQTINPDPRYPAGGALPGDSGEHGAKAVERYRKDAVKDVVTQTTTTKVSGNGGPR